MKLIEANKVLEYIDDLRTDNELWRHPVDEVVGMIEDFIEKETSKEVDGSWLKGHVYNSADYLMNKLLHNYPVMATEEQKIALWSFVRHEVTSAYAKGRQTGIKWGIKKGVEMCQD